MLSKRLMEKHYMINRLIDIYELYLMYYGIIYYKKTIKVFP